MKTTHDSDNEYDPGAEMPVGELYIFPIPETPTGLGKGGSIIASLGMASIQETGRISQYRNCENEIIKQLQIYAKRIIATYKKPIARVIGMGLSWEKEYVMCYDLTNPDEPIEIVGEESIIEAIGPQQVAIINSDDFFFFFGRESD